MSEHPARQERHWQTSSPVWPRSFALPLNSPGEEQHEWVCHLNLEMERVVATIREQPGLSFPSSLTLLGSPLRSEWGTCHHRQCQQV